MIRDEEAPVTDVEAWDCQGACSHEHCLVFSKWFEDVDLAHEAAAALAADGLYVEVDGEEWKGDDDG